MAKIILHFGDTIGPFIEGGADLAGDLLEVNNVCDTKCAVTKCFYPKEVFDLHSKKFKKYRQANYEPEYADEGEAAPAYDPGYGYEEDYYYP